MSKIGTTGMGRKARSTVLALALAAGGSAITLASAESASADTSRCTIRNQSFSDCANVTGIASGSYLTVRTGPGSGYDAKDRLANGKLVAVSCYTTGTVVNGWQYWDRIVYANSSGVLTTGYVSDYYVDTGRPWEWVPHC